MLQQLACLNTWLQEALLLPGLLGMRPSVVAAAVLAVSRRYLCYLPAWPSALVKMTGFSGLDEPKVAAAVLHVEPTISRGASSLWAAVAASADTANALRLLQQGCNGFGDELLGSAAFMGTTFTGSLADPVAPAVSSSVGSMNIGLDIGYGVSSTAPWVDLPNVSLPALHVPPRQPLQLQQQQLGGMHASLLRTMRGHGSLAGTPRSDYSASSTPYTQGGSATELASLLGSMGALQSNSPKPLNARPGSSNSLHQLSGMNMAGDPHTPHGGMMMNGLVGRGAIGADVFSAVAAAAAAAVTMPMGVGVHGLAGSPGSGVLPPCSPDSLLMTMRNLSMTGSPMAAAAGSPRFGFHHNQQEASAPSRLAQVSHAYGAGPGGRGRSYLLPAGAQDVMVMDQWNRSGAP
jgi:hypothetical protein